MAELIIAEFEIDGLSTSALRLMTAAVMHAKTHQSMRFHTVPIIALCRLAGLPILSSAKMKILLKEARKGLAVWEVIDTVLSERDDLPCMSWPVFSKGIIDGCSILFEINELTFDERLIAKLNLLNQSSEKDL
jgi:hypothetical protein